MATHNDVHRICLEVFMEVFASISHEIKNTLAIINEHAGLLEDFALLRADEGCMEISRVQKATTGIHKQVTRSNKIIQKMNVLAHSTDKKEGPVSGQEVLDFCIELSEKKAAAKRITVLCQNPQQIKIDYSLPILEALLFLVLYKGYLLCPEGEEIILSWQISGQQCSLLMAIKSLNPAEIVRDDTAISSLATHLGIEIRTDQEGIILEFNKA